MHGGEPEDHEIFARNDGLGVFQHPASSFHYQISPTPLRILEALR